MSEELQAESRNELRRMAWSIRTERTAEILGGLLRTVSGSILSIDIGCGGMWPSKLLAGSCRRSSYVGGDISLTYLRKAKGFHGSCKVLLDCSNLPFKDSCADLVMSFETLEHVLYPDVALEEMFRVSSKYIILSVPVVGTPLLGLDRLRYNHLTKRIETRIRSEIADYGCGQVLSGLQDTTGAAHVNVFTSSRLKLLCSKSGRIIQTKYGLFIFPRIIQILSRGWGRVVYRAIERRLLSKIPVFRMGSIGNEFLFVVVVANPSEK